MKVFNELLNNLAIWQFGGQPDTAKFCTMRKFPTRWYSQAAHQISYVTRSWIYVCRDSDH